MRGGNDHGISGLFTIQLNFYISLTQNCIIRVQPQDYLSQNLRSFTISSCEQSLKVIGLNLTFFSFFAKLIF